MLLKQFRKKHGRTNYDALEPFITATNKAGGSAHFKSDGFMDFVVENLEKVEWFLGDKMECYSISHYSEQNGDLMADPDMEIGIINDGEHMRVIPLTYQNDFVGVFQRVFAYTDADWQYSPSRMTELDEFLYEWLQNIKEQGFYDDIPNVIAQKENEPEEEEIIF